MRFIKAIILTLSSFVLLSGCGGGDGSEQTPVELQTNYTLDLACQNEGVFPETCVLNDPNNPFANVYINEENKWDLHDAAPSAKSRFYLWATALAKSPNGENQYYTASALHALYTEGGSVVAKTQAIKAYRAVLDHFFDDVTYFLADWLLPVVEYYEVLLRELTGDRLYDPSFDNLSDLFETPEQALNTLNDWGYSYDPVTGQVERNPL
jgi:hypothetical protein